MKTPEEFTQAMNARKDDPDKSEKRGGMSIAVIATLIFSTLVLVTTVVSTLSLIMVVARASSNISFLLMTELLVLPVVMLGLCGATLYACLKRPRWGYAMSLVFAVIYSISIYFTLITPNPHPYFPYKNDVERLGGAVGSVIIFAGILAYMWFMAFGRKTRAYFSGE